VANATCLWLTLDDCCGDATECLDDDPCTVDTCEETICLHTSIPGCCDENADCDDADWDTIDTCVEGTCDNSPPPPFGACTDPTANNYNPDASWDDGSCAWLPPCEEEVCLWLGPYDPQLLTIEVRYTSSVPFVGFQFNLTGATMDEVFGGSTEAKEWYMTNDFNTLVAFSLLLVSIGPGDGVLTILQLKNHPEDVLCLEGVVVSDTTGISLEQKSYCTTKEGMPAIYGCTEPEATNHAPLATIDDGSCLFSTLFQVDMTGIEAFSPSKGLYLQGDFNAWCEECSPMEGGEDEMLWTHTIPLPSGAYEYQFATGGPDPLTESIDIGATCDFNPEDMTPLRGVDIEVTQVLLPPVCFGQCDVCPITTAE